LRLPYTTLFRSDQAELLQKLQRAVDGGDVHARRGLAHFDEDVVGGRVLQGVHGFEHELALRRQPVAALPEVALPVGAHHSDESRAGPAGSGRACGKAERTGRSRLYLKKAMPSSGMASGRALAQRSTSSGVTTFFRCADMSGRSSTSGVCFSPAHVRALVTYPYSRLPPV